MKNVVVLVSILFVSINSRGLEPLSAEDLSAVSGQGGVYLSGDITINENGGPNFITNLT